MKVSTETAESNFASFGVAIIRRARWLLVHGPFTPKHSFNLGGLGQTLCGFLALKYKRVAELQSWDAEKRPLETRN